MMDDHLATLIKSLELELLHPDVRKSTGRLDQLLSDDFVEFGTSAKRYTRQDILEVLPGQREFQFELHDFSLTWISENAVLAIFRLKKVLPESGEKSSSLRSSLWQHREGRWQILFHQGTPQSPSDAKRS